MAVLGELSLVDAKEIGRGETQFVAGGVVQTACRFSTRKAGFALDSLPEGDGFEISVPGRDTVKPSWEADCSRSGSGSVGNRRFKSISLQR
jgi:hypothetical protein